MSIGGKSLHKKDWLQLGLLAGTAATGLGAAGIGPLAGLLGGGGSAAAAGAAAADAAGAGMGSAAEMAAINSAMGMAPGAGIAGSKSVLDSLQALQRANQFAQLAQGNQGGPPQAAVARPQPQVPVSGEGMEYLRRIYGGMR